MSLQRCYPSLPTHSWALVSMERLPLININKELRAVFVMITSFGIALCGRWKQRKEGKRSVWHSLIISSGRSSKQRPVLTRAPDRDEAMFIQMFLLMSLTSCPVNWCGPPKLRWFLRIEDTTLRHGLPWSWLGQGDVIWKSDIGPPLVSMYQLENDSSKSIFGSPLSQES